jgi:pimeloyl-ACP methyl ester carboxylesterase
MASTKPTIVIVGGCWHLPESYSKLTKALQSAGYEVRVPRIPSVSDERPPIADLYTDASNVRVFVETLIDSGRTVVAVAHSYGGQVMTEALYGLSVEQRAAQGLPGGVSRLVYLSAFALKQGEAILTIIRRNGQHNLMEQLFDVGDDLSTVHRDPVPLLVGPYDNEDEVKEYVSTWRRWNAKGWYLPLTHCAWKDIPVTYIVLLNDMTLALNYQREMIDEMKKEGIEAKVVELETGHCPNLTATGDVVKAINGIIASQAAN